MLPEELNILKVALYEYISHRQLPDVQGYLDKRYPIDQGYSEKFREDKRKSVTANLEIATRLRQSLFDDPETGHYADDPHCTCSACIEKHSNMLSRAEQVDEAFKRG